MIADDPHWCINGKLYLRDKVAQQLLELLECLKDARRLLTDQDAIDLVHIDEVIAKADGAVSRAETAEERKP